MFSYDALVQYLCCVYSSFQYPIYHFSTTFPTHDAKFAKSESTNVFLVNCRGHSFFYYPIFFQPKLQLKGIQLKYVAPLYALKLPKRQR